MSNKFTATAMVVFEAETYAAAQQYILAALGANPTADIQKLDLYRWSTQGGGGGPTPSPDFVVNSPETAEIAGMASARLSLAATAYLTDGSGETVENRGVRYTVERVFDDRYGHGWKATIEASDGFPVNQLAMRAQQDTIDSTIPFENVEGKFIATLVPALMTPEPKDWNFQIWVEGISVDDWAMPKLSEKVRRVAFRMTGPQGEAIAGGGQEVP